MIDKALSIMAPHHCYGCTKTGTLLCEDCKYNISSEPFERCISCSRPAGPRGLCQTCRTTYVRAWCVGERTEVLQRLIGSYKFQNVKAAAKPLAELLDNIVGILPNDCIITSVPTVSSHIRERGYDHARLLAKRFAVLRKLPYESSLSHVTTTKQRDASRAERIYQAKQAFAPKNVQKDATYLLIDDIVTTGATVNYAARALRQAGAGQVWVAVIARQPLD